MGLLESQGPPRELGGPSLKTALQSRRNGLKNDIRCLKNRLKDRIGNRRETTTHLDGRQRRRQILAQPPANAAVLLLLAELFLPQLLVKAEAAVSLCSRAFCSCRPLPRRLMFFLGQLRVCCWRLGRKLEIAPKMVWVCFHRDLSVALLFPFPEIGCHLTFLYIDVDTLRNAHA